MAPVAVDPSDVGILEDLVLAAMNEALGKARALAASRMQDPACRPPPVALRSPDSWVEGIGGTP
jgi:DNA-binding protein YbaB